MPTCPILQYLPSSWHQGLPADQVSVWLPLIRVLVVPTFTSSLLNLQLPLSSLLYCFLSLPTQSLTPTQKSGVSTSTGITCEPGQRRPEMQTAPVRPPCLFLLLIFPQRHRMNQGQQWRVRKGGGWPTCGLISNPQPSLQPRKGAGAGHQPCDKHLHSSLLSPQQPVLLGEMNLPIRPPDPRRDT